MTHFTCIPLTDLILKDLKMTSDNEITVKPIAFTDNVDRGSVVISEVRGYRVDETRDLDIFTGTILLTFFDNDFNIVSQNSFPELYEEIHSMYIRHEGSLVLLPSGEFLFSTGFNRVYIFDREGKDIIRTYNRKVKSRVCDDDEFINYTNLNVEDPQEILTNNLFTRVALCPDTNRLLALIDTNTSEHVSERRMRGEVVAVSKKEYLSADTKPEMTVLMTLNEDWKAGLKNDQSVPYVKNPDGSILELSTWPKEPLVSKLKAEGHNLLTNILWSAQPLAMGDGLFFVPVFMEMIRSGSKGYPFFGFVIDSEGCVKSQLKDIDFQEDSAYTKLQFNFTVCRKQKRIFYKNDYGIYLFDYDGNLLEKHYFDDAEIKPLRAYTLLSAGLDDRIIFFHEKNNEFLILSSLSESVDLKSVITDSMMSLKKEKTSARKQYLYQNKNWFVRD